ncbi:pyridine nucleotide-disulfide oxidoreductase [Amycolatopsis deserti]|uniref:Pyridine nucleotide-disulfide oxidoreductase n=1 Tax=Amycolatopsis deserti TaxID=185696 RepID=A0ABQ3JFE3_9PSEU|nr:FAD-dependent oxidoreductase [Amycolatopsis deserti]GHF19308.1 pyridine nucleotide-disulfide oxidoreductase [Amycolatopsis deserti]
MRTIAIAGASLAGLSTARALRERGFDGRLVVVGDEPHRPYDRPPLSKEFLAGAMSAADLALESDDEDLDADWRLGRRAVALVPALRTVELDSGERIVCDGVVLATGARARRLPGPALAGVHTLRTLDDAIALRADLVAGARLVVIGAGFIGAEVASTARGLGLTVTVVEQQAVPLAGPLGAELGALCAALHGDHGVELITGAGVAALAGTDRVRSVHLTDGRELPADVVVVGVGAVPNTEWLAGSGLDAARGVRTDARCATAIPSVVAAGDCAVAHNPFAGAEIRLEHWTNALEQPATAAATLLGHEPVPSTRAPYFWSDQYGTRLQFAGHRRDGDRTEIVDGDPATRRFTAVYRRGDRPVAVFAMNQPKIFGRWRRELSAAPEPVAQP